MEQEKRLRIPWHRGETDPLGKNFSFQKTNSVPIVNTAPWCLKRNWASQCVASCSISENASLGNRSFSPLHSTFPERLNAQWIHHCSFHNGVTV
jgi:hypothetical protein